MKPRGDEYVLQVTEELWEIAYFDQLKLIAIDHPADRFPGERLAVEEALAGEDEVGLRHPLRQVQGVGHHVEAGHETGADGGQAPGQAPGCA